MKWNLVALADVPPQPWRNGGGATRELLAHPGPANWRVRMSVADVQAAGPFSRFEGIERWFAVLEGAGVVLRLAGEERLLTRGDPPLRFDGGVPVHCTLFTGATRDFNLMAAPAGRRCGACAEDAALAPRPAPCWRCMDTTMTRSWNSLAAGCWCRHAISPGRCSNSRAPAWWLPITRSGWR